MMLVRKVSITAVIISKVKNVQLADVVDICAAVTQHQHTGEMDNAV